MKYIQAYVLHPPDNDSYWVPDLKNPLFCCDLCGGKLSRKIENTEFNLKKKNFDISMTYDGFFIASERFLLTVKSLDSGAYISSEIYSKARFAQKYFKLEFVNQLKLDVSAADPEFGPVCPRCGQFKFVVGATDYFVVGGRVNSGFFRTDIEFAEGFERFPEIIVGVDTAALLRAEHLKGVNLEPVWVEY